jgi:hypothetical protein
MVVVLLFFFISAMLVMKNLVEAGVKNIVNFYRSDFVFETQTPDGWYRYTGKNIIFFMMLARHYIYCVFSLSIEIEVQA